VKPEIKIKRVYEPPGKEDGFRILVDRLWPRGLTKEKAAVDQWEKEISPSPALRTWFAHKPERWEEFQTRYRAELRANSYIGPFLEKYKPYKRLTLLYAGKDEAHSHVLMLQAFLEDKYRQKH
jgi:uncharacterized protein YeaO (DUF488 family)